MDQLPIFLSAVDAAKRTGQSERTIRRWTLSGKLPATKDGAQFKIALADLEPLLDARPPDLKELLTRLQALEDLEDVQASPGLSPHRSGAPGLSAASEAASLSWRLASSISNVLAAANANPLRTRPAGHPLNLQFHHDQITSLHKMLTDIVRPSLKWVLSCSARSSWTGSLPGVSLPLHTSLCSARPSSPFLWNSFFPSIGYTCKDEGVLFTTRAFTGYPPTLEHTPLACSHWPHSAPSFSWILQSS